MDFHFEGFGQWIADNTGLIASAAGAACSAYFTEVKTWREKLLCAAMGVLTSVFLTDPIYSFLPILGEKATCFLTGFFGLNVCAAILKSVRRFGDDADFWTLLVRLAERYLPGKPCEQPDKPGNSEEK